MSCRQTSILFVFAAGSMLASAQEIPVTANIRRTTVVSIPGERPVTSVAEGEFYRASDGSVITIWRTDNNPDPHPALPYGSLVSNQRLGMFTVSYRQNIAIQELKLSSPARGPHRPSANSSAFLGEGSIEGLKCARVVAKFGKTGARIGESCISYDYGLELRSEVSPPNAPKPTKMVEELYNIRINVEPDPKLFDISSFNIVVKEPGTPAIH